MIADLVGLFNIPGKRRLVRQQGGKQLTLIYSMSLQTESSQNLPVTIIPTLLTKTPMSNCPTWFAIFWKNPGVCDSAKSATIICVWISGQYYLISCQTFFSFSWFLAIKHRLNASLASSLAKAKPIPSDAPVITAQDLTPQLDCISILGKSKPIVVHMKLNRRQASRQPPIPARIQMRINIKQIINKYSDCVNIANRGYLLFSLWISLQGIGIIQRMKNPEFLNFKLESTHTKPLLSNVDQFSPIPLSRSPLMQQYQKKMEKFLLSDNQALSFENMATPGWSSIVETDKPTTKRTETNTAREELQKKSIEHSKGQRIKTVEQNRPKSPRYSDQINNRLQNNSSYARLKAPPPGMNLASELTERSVDKKLPKAHQSYQSTKKLPKKEMDSNRFKQISVHDHLYLDSKRQEAKKMMHRMVDDEFKKNIMSFQPKISHYTEVLAQNRFKKLHNDPDYRCSRKKNETRKQAPKVDDPTEVQYRHLHIFFAELTNGSHLLSRNTLSVENIPLPCLRSIEPILQQVFMGANLTWTNFLDLFYSKASNTKAFFQLLNLKEKRCQKLEWTKSKLLQGDEMGKAS